jgi:hypothetical protein
MLFTRDSHIRSKVKVDKVCANRAVVSITAKIGLNLKSVKRDKERHYILGKGSVQQYDVIKTHMHLITNCQNI